MKKKMNTNTISKRKMGVEKGMVSIPFEEYIELLEAAANISNEYLSPKEAARQDKEIKQALRDHAAGKTKLLHSFADLRKKK